MSLTFFLILKPYKVNQYPSLQKNNNTYVECIDNTSSKLEIILYNNKRQKSCLNR